MIDKFAYHGCEKDLAPALGVEIEVGATKQRFKMEETKTCRLCRWICASFYLLVVPRQSFGYFCKTSQEQCALKSIKALCK